MAPRKPSNKTTPVGRGIGDATGGRPESATAPTISSGKLRGIHTWSGGDERPEADGGREDEDHAAIDAAESDLGDVVVADSKADRDVLCFETGEHGARDKNEHRLELAGLRLVRDDVEYEGRPFGPLDELDRVHHRLVEALACRHGPRHSL